MAVLGNKAMGGLGVGFCIGAAWGVFSGKMGRGAVLGLLLGILFALIFGWRR